MGFWNNFESVFQEIGWTKFDSIEALEAACLDSLAHGQTYSDYFQEEEIKTADGIRERLNSWDSEAAFLDGVPNWKEVCPNTAIMLKDNEHDFWNSLYKYYYCPGSDSFGAYIAKPEKWSYQKLLDLATGSGSTADQVMNGILEATYPGDGFDALVEGLRVISSELANQVGEVGVTLSVVTEGSRFSCSGFEVATGYQIDTEQIWDDLDAKQREFIEESDRIAELVEDYAESLMQEIEAYLVDSGWTTDEVIEHFLTYGQLNPENCLVGRYWQYRGNHHDGKDCERESEIPFDAVKQVDHHDLNFVVRTWDHTDFGREVSIVAPKSVWGQLNLFEVDLTANED